MAFEFLTSICVILTVRTAIINIDNFDVIRLSRSRR